MPTGATFSIEVEGIDKLLKTFDSYGKTIDKNAVIWNAMKRIGKEVEAKAKGLLQEKIYETPASPYYVRTGLLRSRTVSDTSPKKETKGISISIKSKVHYAKYIEFGTSKMKARAFLMPALQMSKKEITRILKDAINDFLRKGV